MEVPFDPLSFGVPGGDDSRSRRLDLVELGLDLGLESGVIGGESLEALTDARVGDGSRAEPEDEPTQVADRPIQAFDRRLHASSNRRVLDGRSEGLQCEGDAEEELDDSLLQVATDPVALSEDRARPKAFSDPLELERDRRLDAVGLDEPDLRLGEGRSADRPTDRHDAEPPIANDQRHRDHRTDQLLHRAGKRPGDGGLGDRGDDDGPTEGDRLARGRLADRDRVTDAATGKIRPCEGSHEDPCAVVGERPDQGEAGFGAFDKLVDQCLEDLVRGRVPGGRWASSPMTAIVWSLARPVAWGAGAGGVGVRDRSWPGRGSLHPRRRVAPIPELDDVATDGFDRPVELRDGFVDAGHQPDIVCPVGETSNAGLQVAERVDDPIVQFARDPQALGADLYRMFCRSELEELDRARGLRGERGSEADVGRHEWRRVRRPSDDEHATRASDLGQRRSDQRTRAGRRGESTPGQGDLVGITGDDVRGLLSATSVSVSRTGMTWPTLSGPTLRPATPRNVISPASDTVTTTPETASTRTRASLATRPRSCSRSSPSRTAWVRRRSPERRDRLAGKVGPVAAP